MRNCPICESPGREKLKAHYASVQWNLYRCDCGMLYLDSEGATEEGINEFYKTVYISSDGPLGDARLDNLAQFILENCKSPLLDIGGMDGKLASKLAGMQNVNISGAGDEVDGVYRTIILSHTLEHVYNVKGMMEKIKSHITQDGIVVVEVPIWQDGIDWQTYDYHFEHVQKFTPGKLEELFVRNGFLVTLSTALPRYIEYNCHRLSATLKEK